MDSPKTARDYRVSSFATELAQLLKGVQRPGDFYAIGACEIFAPGLEVEGIGPIALRFAPRTNRAMKGGCCNARATWRFWHRLRTVHKRPRRI
jgi:hypothetical protein